MKDAINPLLLAFVFIGVAAPLAVDAGEVISAALFYGLAASEVALSLAQFRLAYWTRKLDELEAIGYVRGQIVNAPGFIGEGIQLNSDMPPVRSR